ncbi:MAG: hypothetical protein V4633_18950 [Pseudomonadota bacterium]
MDSKESPIQDFIFVRELSEVYLLLDHISGRWDKNLYRGGPDQTERRQKNWIEEICKIGWPPEGSPTQLAEQAATLLRAKDRLNEVAKPATGATVAFTLLVVGEDRAGAPWWRRLFQREKAAPAEAMHLPNGAFARPPTRVSLARTAFPGLLTTATRFQWRIKLMVWSLFAWLLFTCILSWNVAAGNLILAHLDRVRAEDRERAQITLAGGEPGRAAVSANMHRLVSLWGAQGRVPQLRNAPQQDADEETVRILTQLVANSVLPLCYGILGAGAAVVRELWAKMRESTLSPRDYSLALGQLALGAVIGACISLFITPAGTAPAQGLMVGTALTGSALSFIAGFGVEGVFVALEGLVRRVFNLSDKK